MAKTDLLANRARDNVVALPPRPRRLRADVVPFDPTNPAHISAWESLWDFGTRCKEGGF